MTDMEVEENPALDHFGLIKPIRQDDIFESQLREIDLAINYLHKEKECIVISPDRENNAKISLPPTNTSESNQNSGSHAILGDITNITQPTSSGSKAHSAKRSWKKLARAHPHNEAPPLEPMHTKRTFLYLDENTPHAGNPKKQCGEYVDMISAEVAEQPRRKP
jgi:hypothetical protein